MTIPANTSSRPRRIATTTVFAAGFAAFWIARGLARESFADANRAAWALRPEIENWADPYSGTDQPALIVGLLAASLILLVGTLGILLWSKRRHVS